MTPRVLSVGSLFLFALGVAACGGDEKKTGTTGSVDIAYNFCPVFDVYTVAPNRVPLGGVAHISVSVADPEGDPMTYAWSAAHGSFRRRYAPETRYVCDTPGLQTLTLVVSDKTCKTSFQVRVECLDNG